MRVDVEYKYAFVLILQLVHIDHLHRQVFADEDAVFQSQRIVLADVILLHSAVLAAAVAINKIAVVALLFADKE